MNSVSLLQTKKKSAGFEWDIHFWLGSETSQVRVHKVVLTVPLLMIFIGYTSFVTLETLFVFVLSHVS